MFRKLAASMTLALAAAAPASATPLYGAVAWPTVRELGGSSEQPPGGFVTVDLAALGPADAPSGASATPGGTALVADVFDPPPPLPAENGWLTGLEYTDGSFYASTFECADDFCAEGPSRLLAIDPTSGARADIGFIRDGAEDLSITDLALHPTTGVLYGISTFLGSSCFGCLYTIDRATAAATLVGEVPLGQGMPGGLAFAPDGTLYLTTVFPIAGAGPAANRNPMDLAVLNPATGALVSREDLLLEQQFIVIAGGVPRVIRSAPMQGLTITPDGRVLATGDNGITVLYERVFASVLNPSGVPVGAPTWVWRVLGDAGENLGDLASVPEPGTAACLALGLALLAGRRRRA